MKSPLEHNLPASRRHRLPYKVVAVTGRSPITVDSDLSLLPQGIEICRYQDPASALVNIGADPPSLVLVDTDIEGIPLPEFVRVLVRQADVPVLVGVRSGAQGRDQGFQALEAGARGLVALPCTAERLARAITQLNLPMRTMAAVLTNGPIVLNTHSRRVLVGGEDVHLTRNEFDALAYLMAEAPRVVRLEELTERCARERPMHPDGLRTALGRARRKFEALGVSAVIENVRGVGYRMSL
ncbi:winged helix-turn-helix transcriptional regulator [Arthrobacter sp. MDT3-24]